MQLYHDLTEKVPEFKVYDIMGEEHYVVIGISPLGSIGSWLKELVNSKDKNDLLIRKICHYLNETYRNADKFTGDLSSLPVLGFRLLYNRVYKAFLRPADFRRWQKIPQTC